VTRRNARRAFGSVRKLPSGRYQARYRDLAGSEHVGPATFATRADANRFLAIVEADLLRGAWSNPRLGKTTFREWVEQWRKTTTSLRPKTTDLYEYLLRRFLLPAFGDLPLAHLDVMAVQTWLAEQHNADQVSPSTIAKAYRLLRRILGCAVQAGYLPQNPCVVRGAGSEHAPEMRIATVEQVAKLADAVPPRYRALVLVAAYGGLRWGELVGLRVRRVNLLHGSVQVAEQGTLVAGKLYVGPPKTAAGMRTVTLPRAAAAELAAHLDRYATSDPDGLVFPAPRGGYLHNGHFLTRVRYPATKQAGVQGLRFHDLRHTAATLAIAAGASTRELMERMGHSSMTAAIRYQHVMPGRDAAIAAALDGLLETASANTATTVTRAANGTRTARRRRKKTA